ncbi:hypothetical protein [Nocardioides sp. KR10-350]|uniref:hypothetical protein n=1 Tax=Nocardioides cheoyonin TaxID=3156615 RepID=UPI0032B526A3
MVQPFPDVTEDQIEAAGHKFSTAAGSMVGAKRGVHGATASRAWQSPTARPAWDDALEARESDLKIAHAVLDDLGDAMVKTAGYLRELRATYDQATFYLMTTPDPRVAPPATSLKDLMVPPAFKPDQKAVAEYEAVERMRDGAASDARFVLDQLGVQLSNASAVTFADPPTDPVHAVSDVGAVVPLGPAFGAPKGALFANGVPIQFGRGNKFESDILKELGLDKFPKSLFRPANDDDLPSDYPFTKSGRLPRGSFPDSRFADILEIKSGTTQINATDPQIRAELELANREGRPLNLVTESQTPVDEDLSSEIERTGGSVYDKVPGEPGVYYDRGTGEYVRLEGAQGPDSRDLGRTPLSPEETRDVQTRVHNQPPEQPETSPPQQEAPYVTQDELDKAWKDDPGGEPVAPGKPGVEEPGMPEEPEMPEMPELPEMPEFPEIIP